MEKIGIDFNCVCKDYGVLALSYQDAPNVTDKVRPDPRGRVSGLAMKPEGCPPIILFDSERSPQEIRFTVAHELGHILLGHLDFRTQGGDIPAYAEMEANCFAAVLMAYDVIGKYGREVSA